MNVFGSIFSFIVSISAFKSSNASRIQSYRTSSGYTCGINPLIFRHDNVYSMLPCSLLCSEHHTCKGFQYSAADGQCKGCNAVDSAVNTKASPAVVYKRREGYGWVPPINGVNLWVYFDEVTKPEADTVCKRDGGRLAVIDEAWLMSNISAVLETFQHYAEYDHYWTAGEKSSFYGAWKFPDGTNMPMDSPTFWGVGKPDSNLPKAVNCVRLWKNTAGDYRWNDRDCTQKFRFICEF